MKNLMIKFDKQYIYYYGGEFHINLHWSNIPEGEWYTRKITLSLKKDKKRILINGWINVIEERPWQLDWKSTYTITFRPNNEKKLAGVLGLQLQQLRLI